MKSDRILNVRVDGGEYTSSVDRFSQWIHTKDVESHYVIQTNINSLVSAQENSLYLATINTCDLSLPDGMPLVWLLRLKGHKIKDRVYGPDLMLMLCEEAAKRGWRCFLYGGKPGVPEDLRDNLVERYPGLNIVGTYSPPFRELTPEEDAGICKMISETKPDILWVGLGAPKQDIWMFEHRDKIAVSVMHGVGAAFDFLTGRVRQAPRWMMNSGLEWLFRLSQEPKRLWKRYTITNMKFFYYLVIREILRIPLRHGKLD